MPAAKPLMLTMGAAATALTLALAAHAVQMGYDLRLVCRELARVVRPGTRAAIDEVLAQG